MNDFCSKHQLKHIYGFKLDHWCPACEKELHGSKGIVSKDTQPLEEITVPFGEIDFKLIRVVTEIQQQWEINYGEFKKIHVIPICAASYRLSFKIMENLIAAPEGWLLTTWHDSIAKVWPI